VKKKRFIPEEGSMFYAIACRVNADSVDSIVVPVNRDHGQSKRLFMTNCFRTKLQAEKARKAIIKILRGEG
jgi:hypothetical protein